VGLWWSPSNPPRYPCPSLTLSLAFSLASARSKTDQGPGELEPLAGQTAQTAQKETLRPLSACLGQDKDKRHQMAGWVAGIRWMAQPTFLL
jgi:hypothetical protein